VHYTGTGSAPMKWIVKQTVFFENRENQQKMCNFYKIEGEKLPKAG
jgi:hypothetical protein